MSAATLHGSENLAAYDDCRVRKVAVGRAHRRGRVGVHLRDDGGHVVRPERVPSHRVADGVERRVRELAGRIGLDPDAGGLPGLAQAGEDDRAIDGTGGQGVVDTVRALEHGHGSGGTRGREARGNDAGL